MLTEMLVCVYMYKHVYTPVYVGVFMHSCCDACVQVEKDFFQHRKIYMVVFMRVCTHAYVRVYTCTYMQGCFCVFEHVWMCDCMYAYVSVCVHLCMDVYVCTHGSHQRCMHCVYTGKM